MRKLRPHLFDILFLLFFPLIIAFIRLDDWWHMRHRQEGRGRRSWRGASHQLAERNRWRVQHRLNH
jgi:hypothetical protein